MNILYFGIYNKDFSRNHIYMQGLRNIGVTVLECQNNSPGFIKYYHLFMMHWKMRHMYDAVIVGYPGHLVVPFARLISNKIVVADLLGSLEDAEIHSHSTSLFKRLKSKIVDWLAVLCAHVVLLESNAQRDFFIEKFGNADKYKVVYTGADKLFEVGVVENKKDNGVFRVLFRGSLTPESGIAYILKAADILRNNTSITFRIIGRGRLLSFVEYEIKDKKLAHVELISNFLSKEKLVELSREAHLSLGQFENNPRLNRTIPHKAFESFALGVPYLTGNAPAISELVQDDKTAFLVPLGDETLLAEKIAQLSSQLDNLDKVAYNAKQMYTQRLSAIALATRIKEIIDNTVL